MTLGLPKAVVKIVAERNERIADVPINALYIAFFLSIAVSLPRNRRRLFIATC